ncbi:MAG TPA: hypothetical protein VL947_03940, partial [Cytophagales bacterium]|nr:hypothetical protein [Cytophagales bacterium]
MNTLASLSASKTNTAPSSHANAQDSAHTLHHDLRPEAVKQRKLQNIANNSLQIKKLGTIQNMANKATGIQSKVFKNVSKGPIVQAYFHRAGNFFSTLAPDILHKLRAYIAEVAPNLVQEFDDFSGNRTAYSIDTWLKDKCNTTYNAALQQGTLLAISQDHPQTSHIPVPWMASTSTHNPGGPPITVIPSPQNSPPSSQEEDMV